MYNCMENIDNILNYIKAKRKVKGYSQEYMGNQLGMDYSFYGRLENGKTHIKLDRLLEICEILEINVADLFDFDNETKVQTHENSYPTIRIEFSS
jgi:transcriptional regulator with XRE-family HTH domain